MDMIIIKSEDPIHGASTKSFNTREEAEAYMDSIGMVKTPVVMTEATEEPKAVKAPKAVKKPVKKVVKAKTKKR